MASASLALLFALSACSANEPGTPLGQAPSGTQGPGNSSGSKPTSGAPSSDDTLDVPKVNQPLATVDKYQKAPCDGLTSAQLKTLNLDSPGEARQTQTGLSCLWQNSDRGSVNFGWIENNGIAGAYTANKNGKVQYFEPIPSVEGFPATISNIEDLRSQGRCSIVVGTSEESSFVVHLAQSASKRGTAEPCDVAVMVVGEVLKTMKAG